ncbi:MAG TPA: transposase [Longimicrobiales bacterium]
MPWRRAGPGRTLPSMGRRLRPHLSGGTFHLTARVQGREALFTAELRTELVAILREVVAFSDVELFAYVVMPNHLHVVLRQGRSPLSRFMQPLLRRVALRVHRRHAREGHVFERRFRSHPCSTPEHLRNAVVYTHLNPVRAGLCTEPGEYAWSSHGAWMRREGAADRGEHPVMLERVAQVFASGPARTPSELARDYAAFLEWRRECDRMLAAGEDHGEPVASIPPAPPVEHGDANWALYVASSGDTAGHADDDVAGTVCRVRMRRADLGEIAGAVIRAEPGLIPALVRSRWGGPAYVRARRAIIRQAAAAGYRAKEIAAYLRISTTTVSDVLTAERKRLLSVSR